jgi:hypothetical protein
MVLQRLGDSHLCMTLLRSYKLRYMERMCAAR